MGVFARLLRRSKTTEEASTAEVQADTLTAETEAEVAEEAKGSSETEDEATAETAGAATTDDVEIPKQQTAEKAADNEAGEGARK
ncbi:hypothetical protein [Streptomyces sp. NBC_00035]|uniref:hypothetical protein n=1 Tax=unclassified Streptomyces TaxID=2593676 RepID=UPI00308D3023|nr:hypothetical protein OHT59_12910 [Streptomyces sp. NBC_00243]